MGRAKLNMELISKEKSRNLTFKKRKEGLIRKLHEFTTLCDVKACMVIYGNGVVQPEIWPQNADEINRIIGIYKAKSKDSGNKAYCLSDFFHDRKRKIEEELAKLRKKNMESKYPTSIDPLNFMTETQLRVFAASLIDKAMYVRSRIEILRRNQLGFGLNLGDFGRARLIQSQNSFYSGGIGGGAEFGVINHEQQAFDNSMMMLLMNEDDQFLQFGGASSIQTASFNRQVFCDSMCSPNPSAQFYMPPPPPHMLPYTTPLQVQGNYGCGN